MIKRVYYEIMKDSDLIGYDPNAYFYYQNMINLGNFFADGYESYELSQRNVLDRVVRRLIDDGTINKPQLDDVSMMISTVKNKPAILIEL